jgi:hypothetical protein
MNPINKLWVRILIVLVTMVGGLFSLVSPARAQGIQVKVPDSVPTGTVVTNDTLLVGQTVTLNGTVQGDAAAFGNLVEINGEVQGSLIAGGQTVKINGKVGGTTYVAALFLELGPEAELSSNVYFVGLDLVTEPTSKIGRDLASLTMGGKLTGEIGRNTMGLFGPFAWFRAIMNLIGRPVSLGASLEQPQLPAQVALPLSTLQSGLFPSLSGLSHMLNALPGAPAQAAITGQDVLNWFLWVVRKFVTLMVFGLIALWLLFPQLGMSAKKVHTKPLQSTGYGFLGLVLAFFALIAYLLVVVLVIVLGVGLAYLKLWELAAAVWVFGLLVLKLVLALSVLFVSIGTKVIVSFMLGYVILNWLAPKGNEKKIYPLLLGTAIYVLLASIPILGWVVAVLATAIGLGGAWLALRERGQTIPLETVIPAEDPAVE